jgi:MraZ protein
MAPFLGTETYAIDDKGRIAIPPAFRGGRGRARDAKPMRFVLMAGLDGELWLHSPEAWVRLEQKLLKLSLQGREGRGFARAMLQDVTPVSVDGQGRITVTPALRSRAGLGKEAVLHGLIDRIEIWDPSRFEAAIARYGNLTDLAEDFFKD